jgi:hypothetical protein
MSSNDIKKDAENMFDLNKLPDIEDDYEIKKSASIISTIDQNKLLEGCVEIPRDQWDDLKYHDFVKYLRKDGCFRKGGYFKNSWVGNYGKTKDKKCIQLASSKNFKSTMWTICHDVVDKMWKTKDVEINNTHNTMSPEIMTMINEHNESIVYLSTSMNNIKTEMSRLNNEQKRIINLIKKLHGIKSK